MNTATENTAVQQGSATAGKPIAVNWKFKNDDGSANLMFNPDGTYLFSGEYKEKEPGHDFDISLALRSTAGGIIIFHYAGDASNGVKWSKQGQNEILKENYTTFASKHAWSGEFKLPLSTEGRAKLYADQEKKKEQLKMEAEEAEKRHDEKAAAEKKAELAKEWQEEGKKVIDTLKASEAKAKASGGGGDSVMNTIGDVAGVVGTILAFL